MSGKETHQQALEDGGGFLCSTLLLSKSPLRERASNSLAFLNGGPPDRVTGVLSLELRDPFLPPFLPKE